MLSAVDICVDSEVAICVLSAVDPFVDIVVAICVLSAVDPCLASVVAMLLAVDPCIGSDWVVLIVASFVVPDCVEAGSEASRPPFLEKYSKNISFEKRGSNFYSCLIHPPTPFQLLPTLLLNHPITSSLWRYTLLIP